MMTYMRRKPADWVGSFLSEGGKTILVSLMIFAIAALVWVMW